MRHQGVSYPVGIVGKLGWHTADTACPIGPGTFDAVCASADVAVTAAQMVLDGDDAVYALCRPPGHHAYRSEEHTSELQSLMRISYAVFCLKKKNKRQVSQTSMVYTHTEYHTEC